MQRGVILISTLIVIVMLSSIAALMTKDFYLVLNSDQQISFNHEAYFVSDFVESIAMDKLSKAAEQNLLSSNSSDIFNKPFYYEHDDLAIDVVIQDASTCFNVNSIFNLYESTYVVDSFLVKGLYRFLDRQNLSEIQKNMIVDQLVDWVDSDQEKNEFGLEDYDYTNSLATNKKFTASRLFHNSSELYNLPIVNQLGLDLDIINLCAYNLTHKFAVNLNSLTVTNSHLLRAIFPFITSSEAYDILSSYPHNGFQSIGELKLLFPNINFSQDASSLSYSFVPSIFHIKTSVSNGKKTATIDSVVSMELYSKLKNYKKQNVQQMSKYTFQKLYHQVNGI